MESEIEVLFFFGGTQADPPITGINQASQHPDLTDVNLDEIVAWVSDGFSLGKDIYGQKWFDVAKDVGNLVKDVFKDKNQGKTISSRLILLGPGAFPVGPAVDEARVTFRAWSEDDLTASFGRVDPFGKIIDLREKRYDDPEGNHVYEYSFSIPLKHTPPGPYFFSFGSGDSGWHYKVGIASMLTVGIAQSRHSGFLVQSTFGTQGNFEVVVPRASGGLSHFWRDNNPDAHSSWHGPFDFASDAGQADAVSLIQSNFGTPGVGNFELVVRMSDRLVFFWKADQPQSTWQGPIPLVVSGVPISGISGNPALIQSTFGIQGRFEVVVPRAEGGLSYFWRDNDPGANLAWHGPFDFATDVGQVDAVSLIQSNFGPPGVGELEVVARIRSSLAHFRRVNDDPPYAWVGPQYFAEGVSGIPSLIQGWYGSVGNYDLVVPRVGGGLAHYWRNNDVGQNMTWNGPFSFADQLGQVDAVSLIQSNFGTPGIGNLEVVARIGNRLADLWRMDTSPFNWSDPVFFETPPSRLILQVQPSPLPVSQDVTVTVFAEDEATGRAVDGDVIIDDSEVSETGSRGRVGRTNTPFDYTFKSKVEKTFDPVTKTWTIDNIFYPTGSVLATGYSETAIDFRFRA